MTITVTVADVKEFCVTPLSDAALTALITVVQSKMGECVETSYSLNLDVGKQILIYAVCHLAQSQDGSVTSEKAANGSSVSYGYYGTGEGVKSTSSGRLLVMIDSAGCYHNLFASPLLFTTVGDSTNV